VSGRRFLSGYRYLTKEPTPRSVHVLGPCVADPDVYVCRPEGMTAKVLMNCGSSFDGKIIGTEIYLDEATATPVGSEQ
jgi:hypothetical protein